MPNTLLEVPQDRNYQSLPIVRVDYATAVTLTADSAAPVATVPAVKHGAIIVTPSVPVFISLGRDASAASGSILIPAGSAYHTTINGGEIVSVLAVDASGPVCVARLT